MVTKIVIEWKYSPKEYFETDLVIPHDKGDIDVKSGVATASVEPKHADRIDDIVKEITENLKSRFLAVQAMTHQRYTLEKPSRYDLNDDGTKITYVNVGHAVVLESGYASPDILIKDKDGNVIRDSKQERIDKKKWIAEACAKYRTKDDTLDQILKSYDASVKDPDNELVHLYEIRDAVQKKFGGKKGAKHRVGICDKEWSDFGTIANKKPLSQSRHRGVYAGKLRKADASELETVRKVAFKIIENYLKCLIKDDEVASDIKKVTGANPSETNAI